jgi:hypothetical protein
MARAIEAHKVNGLNEAIDIVAEDERGPGNANHFYTIVVNRNGMPLTDAQIKPIALPFQNGGIAEVGVNGISNEALLAIVIDRMQGFQAGPFACRENALALTKLEEAMHWLHHRTRARVARGVEGTLEK